MRITYTYNGVKHASPVSASQPSWPPPWAGEASKSPEPLSEPPPQVETSTWPKTFLPASDERAAYNEHCWRNISDEARAYLLGHRERPAPCPWCGGRLRHSVMCAELHAAWEPKLPFGKHAGKRLSDTPKTYLLWLLRNSHSLDSELRTAIEERIRGK